MARSASVNFSPKLARRCLARANCHNPHVDVRSRIVKIRQPWQQPFRGKRWSHADRERLAARWRRCALARRPQHVKTGLNVRQHSQALSVNATDRLVVEQLCTE